MDCLRYAQPLLGSTVTRETMVIEEMMVDGGTMAWKEMAVSG